MSRFISGSSGINQGTAPNRGSNYTYDGSVTGSYDAPNDDSEYTGSVADKVRRSEAYINAYKLFLNEPNRIWLQRLEAIPTSVLDASNTYFDDIGLSNKYEDKQSANYQYCIEQINALVAEYQAWKNSLPTTQVQQLADAGINSAITGQGVTGSDIPNVGVSTDPSQLQSTNPIDVISSLGSLVTNTSNGLLSWCQLFNQVTQFGQNLDFQKDSFNRRLNFDQSSFDKTHDLSFKQWAHNKGIDYAKLNAELVGLGLNPINDEMSVEDVVSWFSQSSYYENAFLSNIIKSYQLDNQYQLQARVSESISSNVVQLANLQYDIYKSDLELKRLVNKRSKAENDYTLGYYGDDPARFGQHMKDIELEIKDCMAQRSDIEANYVKSLVEKANKGDTTSAYMLIQYLMGIGFTDYTRMQRGAGQTYFDDTYLPKIIDMVKSMSY